jgi:hypothetical protein
MFKKILMCAVSIAGLACAPAVAADFGYHHRVYRHAHLRTVPPIAVVPGILPYYAPLGPQPVAYPPLAGGVYNRPLLAFSHAVVPVPVRVYYIPQREPYYNVPPYIVPEPIFWHW